MMNLSRLLRPLRVLAFALPLAATTACLGDTTAPEPVVSATVAGTTFATSLGIDLATFTALPSGLYYKDLAVGTGAAPAADASVTVNYVLRLPNGAQIDPNPSQALVRALPFTFGKQQVIPGFEQGVVGMRVGGRRTLLVPPDLAYGPNGAPGNVVLVFTVDLVSIP